MRGLTIQLAGPGDADRVNGALRQLSEELGDIHRVETALIARVGWGVFPVFRAMLACRGEEVVGIALYSPTFSTTRGGTVAYVSDLWVTAEERGSGLGRCLLAEVFQDSSETWEARGLKLNVYHSSPKARAFYERLGFEEAAGRCEMTLDAAGCAALEGAA